MLCDPPDVDLWRLTGVILFADGSLAEGQGGRSQKCPRCYTGGQHRCQPAPLPPSPRATRGQLRANMLRSERNIANTFC